MCANIINDSFSTQKAKVLIVDDSNVTLKIQEDLITAYGIDVVIAKSGEECLAFLNTNRYNLIFMDHMMPNMDGIETTLKIRNKKKPINIDNLNKILRAYLPRQHIMEIKLPTPTVEDFNELQIKDVDTKKAIQNCCGNINNYLSLLSVTYHDGKNKLKVIKDFATHNDIKNYTIEVHALKTVATLVGHTKLSELSKRHEIAGTNNNLIFILENVDSLLSVYDSLLNNIKAVLPEEDIEIKPKIKDFTVQNLSNLVKATANAIDNFDLDLINESLDHLLNYDLSDSQISTLNKVRSFINVFDYDNAYELITNFKYSL